jgi:hypothetical protein
MLLLAPILLAEPALLVWHGPARSLDYKKHPHMLKRIYVPSSCGILLSLGRLVDLMFGFTETELQRNMAGTVVHALLAFAYIGLVEPIRQNASIPLPPVQQWPRGLTGVAIQRHDIAPCAVRMLEYRPSRAPSSIGNVWHYKDEGVDLRKPRSYLVRIQCAIFVPVVLAVIAGLKLGCGFDYRDFWVGVTPEQGRESLRCLAPITLSIVLASPLWDVAEMVRSPLAYEPKRAQC